MCASAIQQARLKELIFATVDPKAGGVVSLFQIVNDLRLNHQVKIIGGIEASAAGQLLINFFKNQRAQKK